MQDGQHRQLQCHIDDEQLLGILQKRDLPHSTRVLLVHDSSLDSVKADLYTSVCENFRCMRLQDIWNASQSLLRHAESGVVQSYLNHLLAEKAEVFYGNNFSLVGRELCEAIQSKKGKCHFYNPEADL